MYVTVQHMNSITRIPTPIRWILLGLSFPIGGFIVFIALGPITTPVLALIGGTMVGLVIGAAEAFALRLPIVRWTVATAIGLGAGSLLAALAASLLPAGPLATVATALVAGVVTAAAQLLAQPPLPRLLWLAVHATGWVIAWLVSLVIAISTTQGFIIFGASGALVFTVGLFLIVRFAGRRTRATATATAAVPA
jgi:hypothetical protein